MILNSPYVSGSLTVTGNACIAGTLNASITGSVTTASYSRNAELLDNLDSTAFVYTSSYNSDSSSVSSRVTKIEGNYATTGSNIFLGAQIVCANITSTGTIIAQTLNVQQVTSSILYSSGSNKFGCQLTDIQQMTGSLRVTGSGVHYIQGGCVGINTSTPAHALQINGPLALSNLAEEYTSNLEYAYPIIYAGNKSGLGNGDLVIQPRTTATRGIYFATRTGGAVSATNPGIRMAITYDGLVGIGTSTPGALLDVYKCVATNINIISTNLYQNQGNLIQFCQNTTGGNVVGYIGHAGDSSGDFTIFNGATKRLAISSTGITCFACQVCVPRLEVLRSSANNGLFIYSNSGAAPISCTMVQINGLTNDSTGNILTLASLNDGIRMVVRNDGNVGIGTSTPLSTLDIRGNGIFIKSTSASDPIGGAVLSLGETSSEVGMTGGISFAEDLDSNPTRVTMGIYYDGINNKMHIVGSCDNAAFVGCSMICAPKHVTILRDSGNVGIGITNPDVGLHINKVPNSNNEAVYNLILQDPTSFSSRIGAGISFGGYYDSTNTTFTFANIKGFKENITSGDYAGALAFSTRVNGGNPTERMRITSAGNVGIGTSSPATSSPGGTLDACGAIISRGFINDHLSCSGVLQYYNGEVWIRAYGPTAGSGVLAFRTCGGAGTSDAERMRITSCGTVKTQTNQAIGALEQSGTIANNNCVTLNLNSAGGNGSIGFIAIGVSRTDNTVCQAVRMWSQYHTQNANTYSHVLGTNEGGITITNNSNGGETIYNCSGNTVNYVVRYISLISLNAIYERQ